jgi:hypothetical protein
MLFWWGEKIPFISTPEDIGSIFYLGPYFNLLPILAVGLMLWQQNKMMPPPTDEQMAQQQQMMKIMLILMGIFFYKIAAGLVLYFIISTIWGMVERQFIPKLSDSTVPNANKPAISGAKSTDSSRGHSVSEQRVGFLGRLKERLQERLEELQRQADEQAKRQIRNNRPPSDEPKRRRKKR